VRVPWPLSHLSLFFSGRSRRFSSGCGGLSFLPSSYRVFFLTRHSFYACGGRSSPKTHAFCPFPMFPFFVWPSSSSDNSHDHTHILWFFPPPNIFDLFPRNLQMVLFSFQQKSALVNSFFTLFMWSLQCMSVLSYNFCCFPEVSPPYMCLPSIYTIDFFLCVLVAFSF